MMSWKDNFISEHSEEEYEKILARNRARYKAHKEEHKTRHKEWRETHLEAVIAASQEQNRKGGRRYAKTLAYSQTGIPGEKRRIRVKHTQQYKPYKDIIAPDSQLHHQWRPQSHLYDGLALVEADQHMHGFIDIIQILEGKITVFTEEELRAIGEDL